MQILLLCSRKKRAGRAATCRCVSTVLKLSMPAGAAAAAAGAAAAAAVGALLRRCKSWVAVLLRAHARRPVSCHSGQWWS
jgi:hypothetical protein